MHALCVERHKKSVLFDGMGTGDEVELYTVALRCPSNKKTHHTRMGNGPATNCIEKDWRMEKFR